MVFVRGASLTAQTSNEVDFGSEIRPILSDTCFKCHGPDEQERKAGLRLDSKEAVFDEFGAIVPGDPAASDFYDRVISDDPDFMMPPPDSGRVLTNQQKNSIRLWIEQGADWEQHWSFIAPVKIEPAKDSTGWAQTPIDHFIRARLAAKGLAPSPEASRTVLIRRVAFDLTGLPPTAEQLSRFKELQDENWYEQLVDELIESPQYGEHMARFWLDAARYGDTHGLHLDNYREMWPYRDWVIEAFNRNLPFKDFVIEQLAGDMLEGSTDDQKIASGFNRAHVTTSEGGSIAEEVYVRNVIDRVSTTGTVFLGLTIECAQCHDHKFDPISQREFYQLFAFFNNMTDPPLDKNIKDPQPILRVGSDQQKSQLKQWELELGQIKSELKTRLADYPYVDVQAESQPSAEGVSTEIAVEKKYNWLDDGLPAGAKPQSKWEFVADNAGPVQSGETSRVQSNDQLVQHFFTDAVPIRVQAGDRFFAYVYLDPKNPPSQIMLQFNDGDWNHRVYWGADKIDWGKQGESSRYFAGELPALGEWIQLEVPVEKVGFKNLSLVSGMAFTQWGGKAYWDSAGVFTSLDQTSEFRSLSRWLKFTRLTKGQGLPEKLRESVNLPDVELNSEQKGKLRDYFLVHIHPDARRSFADLLNQQVQVQKQLDELTKMLPTTLISEERDDIKPAYVLNRGEYDQHGDEVQRETPSILPPFPSEAPRNRLGLANWLVAKENPLTARVAVNRFWQQVFGTALVKTAEDFGAQGDRPSHPDLLDWLAVDFVENDWDVKRLMKAIVTSATYRQSSRATPELIAKDPENRLLARGPRFRLDAETLRDQALAVSGLLVQEIGGPSVKPPQPDGLWFVVGYSGSNTVRFKKDHGQEKVHRRSLYTFWKRTSPPPQMNTFDAPSRESCSVRRERTNTPLQALMLMNDPQYVEAARYLAQRTIDSKVEDESRLKFLFSTALNRQPSNNESKLLLEMRRTDAQEFEADVENARKLTAIGEVAADTKYDPVELASWTMLASLVMNSDEFVSKN